MKSTIFSVLTDTTARDSSIVKAGIAKEFSAGIPWWNEPAQ